LQIYTGGGDGDGDTELRVTGTLAEDVPFAWAMQVTVTVLGVENVVGAV